jgi:hypothetical protein
MASQQKFSTIVKVESASSSRLWRLELSCGHVVYEKQTKKPSIWLWECVGRRRKKRCRACESRRS